MTRQAAVLVLQEIACCSTSRARITIGVIDELDQVRTYFERRKPS